MSDSGESTQILGLWGFLTAYLGKHQYILYVIRGQDTRVMYLAKTYLQSSAKTLFLNGDSTNTPRLDRTNPPPPPQSDLSAEIQALRLQPYKESCSGGPYIINIHG